MSRGASEAGAGFVAAEAGAGEIGGGIFVALGGDEADASYGDE